MGVARKWFTFAIFLVGLLQSGPGIRVAADDSKPLESGSPNVSAEIEFWQSVKDTNNPLELEAFIAAYPTGKFSGLAMIRLQALREAQEKSQRDGGSSSTTGVKTQSSTSEQSVSSNGVIPSAPKSLTQSGYIGMELKELPGQGGETASGGRPVTLRVERLFSFGPAAESGIQAKDVIISANDRRFESVGEFVRVILNSPVGTPLDLVVFRDGRRKLLTIRVGDRLESYWRGAHRNDPVAMAFLGSAYQYGRLITKDYDKAYSWLKKSADAGEPFGERQLAVLYQDSGWSKMDWARSLEWLEKAIGHGDSYAKIMAGNTLLYGTKGVKADPERAVGYYRSAAAEGYAQAQYGLGRAYTYGRGVEKDLGQAFKWFRKSAENNLGDGQFQVGYMLDVGQGVKEDNKEAAAWYEKAAARGQSQAMINLAILYHLGDGVPKDVTKAAEWYEKGEAAGNLEGKSGVGWMYEFGVGGRPKDYAKAVSYYQAAADKGNASGQFNLARLYEMGKGVAKDRSEAVRLYRLAAASDDRATKRLKELGEAPYDLREMQRNLIRLGFDPGGADGKLGGKTRAAIRAFQEREGLSLTGRPTPELALRLRNAGNK